MIPDVGSGRRAMYLHVGAPKTGTTFLQSVLWAARDELIGQGLTLPMRKLEDHVRAAQDVRELYDEQQYSPKARGGLDRFAASLPEVATPRALFSMEIVAAATPKQIERFFGVLGDFDVHIIITARDLARQIPSGWQQRVKRRRRTPYDQYLRNVLEDPALTLDFWRSQDVAEVAQRWGEALPPPRVHIVTVPPAGAAPRLLLQRFCAVIGVDPNGLDTEVAVTNSSLSSPQAELMRRVNTALGERLTGRRTGYNQLAKTYLAKTVLAAQGGPALKLPARYADRCRAVSARISADLAAAGYDIVGNLSDLEPTVFGAPNGNLEQFNLDANDENVAESAVQAIATMLVQRHEDLTVIADLRTRLHQAQTAETWAHKQRRRLSMVKDDPALLLDRLPRPGRR